MGRLDGKVAFITGTAGGQGRAAARLFAAEGARVVGCDMKVEESRETVAMVEEAGGAMISTAPLDLGDAESVREWIDGGRAEMGGLDVLYNNAAAVRFGPIATMSAEDWDFTLRNELDILFHTCQAAWPHLIRDGGSVINTASVSGWRAVRAMEQFAHGGGKAGVIGMSRHLAAEGAPHKVRVNTISPGLVETPATADLPPDPSKSFDESFGHVVPLGRVAQPEDIAYCALYLASDESSYITGADIIVDGGVSAVI